MDDAVEWLRSMEQETKRSMARLNNKARKDALRRSESDISVHRWAENTLPIRGGLGGSMYDVPVDWDEGDDFRGAVLFSENSINRSSSSRNSSSSSSSSSSSKRTSSGGKQAQRQKSKRKGRSAAAVSLASETAPARLPMGKKRPLSSDSSLRPGRGGGEENNRAATLSAVTPPLQRLSATVSPRGNV